MNIGEEIQALAPGLPVRQYNDPDYDNPTVTTVQSEGGIPINVTHRPGYRSFLSNTVEKIGEPVMRPVISASSFEREQRLCQLTRHYRFRAKVFEDHINAYVSSYQIWEEVKL